MEDLVVKNGLIIPAREVRVSFARSGGPGGQNVNKVETKVELRWKPARSSALGVGERERVLQRLARRLTSEGDLIVTSERTRDQVRNRADAAAKLARLVAWALERPKPRRPTKPTRQSVERRLREKKERSRLKQSRQSHDDGP